MDTLFSGPYNLLVVLGPTASGKTRLAVQLARPLGGEIISADSRQVYRGLTLGSGKDLEEYGEDDQRIKVHLIDEADLEIEYSVFHFQHRFFECFEHLQQEKKWPILTGGTGLYLEAALRKTRLPAVPPNPALRQELTRLSDEALQRRLMDLKPRQHNLTDLRDRDRMVRAIEIAESEKKHVPEPAPAIHPLILGTLWPREELRRRIRQRLLARLEQGLIREVEELHANGVSWQRLHSLGLEYRHVAAYLQQAGGTYQDMVDALTTAINHFAKRQLAWFRRMERQGHKIHWIERADADQAWRLIREEGVALF